MTDMSGPDPLVLACLSKRSDRAFYDSHLPFRKSHLNKLRREGLEYEARAHWGTTI